MCVQTWQPRVDGVFFSANPYDLVAAGKYARVPLLNTDDDDEG